MSSSPPESRLRSRLSTALRDAKRRRDLTAVAGLSTAVTALSDAETISLPGDAGIILAMGLAPQRIAIGELHVRRLFERLRDERETEASACRARGEDTRHVRLCGEASAIAGVLLEI